MTRIRFAVLSISATGGKRTWIGAIDYEQAVIWLSGGACIPSATGGTSTIGYAARTSSGGRCILPIMGYAYAVLLKSNTSIFSEVLPS